MSDVRMFSPILDLSVRFHSSHFGLDLSLRPTDCSIVSVQRRSFHSKFFHSGLSPFSPISVYSVLTIIHKCLKSDISFQCQSFQSVSVFSVLAPSFQNFCPTAVFSVRPLFFMSGISPCKQTFRLTSPSLIAHRTMADYALN